MELWEYSAWRLAEFVTRGQLSVSEVVEAHLTHLQWQEGIYHALITPLVESARERARILDTALAGGADIAPLCGVPVVLKDNICVQGCPTTCGSRMLEHWIAPYNATVVEQLLGAGAVVLGKSNMDEFAMGSSTEHSFFGPTRNPRDPDRVPGGSSGGSAAAVAAGYAPLALGSDTGGSIRQPAAFCGVHGLKPTYGMVSRHGLVAFASSFDQIGPMARDVGDLAVALEVLGKADDRDATCSPRPRSSYLDAVQTDSLKGRRIGMVREFAGSAVDPELHASMVYAARICQDAGAALVDVSLRDTIAYGLAAYYILAPAEASSNLSRFDGVRFGFCREAETLQEQYQRTRGEGFGPEVKRRILTGAYVLSAGYYDAYYGTAQKMRRRVAEEFDTAFQAVDVILLPTSPCLPFRPGEMNDPLAMYLTDIFTSPANLAGLPALSLATGTGPSGLPLSVQLVGRAWGEHDLLGVAAVLERVFGAPHPVTGTGGKSA